MTDMTDTTDTPARPASRWLSGRTTALAVLLLTAVAGILLGVVLDRRVLLPHRFHVMHGMVWRHGGLGAGAMFPGARAPGEWQRHAGDRLARELNLTPAQRVQVDSIMARRMAAFQGVRRETEARVTALLEETRRAIDSVLTPEQQARFHAMRHPRMGEPGVPGGPPSMPPPGGQPGGPGAPPAP